MDPRRYNTPPIIIKPTQRHQKEHQSQAMPLFSGGGAFPLRCRKVFAKMTASAVFILDVKGKVIISRNYRGDVPMNCVERFSGHVLEADEADERPVWLEHGTTYVYIKYNNLYIMAVTTRNSNAAMILLFLYRLVEVRSTTVLTLLHQR